MAVRITTLGTLRVERDGRSVDRLLASRNRSALLVYLAVERDVTRDAAMTLLWPDRPPARARHLLSQTLYELRQELGDEWVEAKGERLHATGQLHADVVAFQEAMDAEAFERALELYGGPFLPGSALAVSRSMEGWIDGLQARVTRLHRRARRETIDARADAGDLQGARRLALSWVELDPLDDEAQHRLIELLAATGDRSGALRQYERYARLVEEELELEPLDATQALVARIREGEVGERTSRELPEQPAPASESEQPAAASESEDEPGEAPEPSLVDRIAAVGGRRTVQWTLAYLALSLALLEGLDQLIQLFDLPPFLLRILAPILALGAILVLGISWSSSRARSFGNAELALSVLVGVFVLSLPAWFARGEVGAEGEAEAGLNPRRIAVLHFEDLSPESELRPEAAGFTEALIHELGQVDGLDVLSRAAVDTYRDRTPPLDSIVGHLEAGMLVGGSITRFGDSIRVMFQLINGETATHVLSGTLTRPAGEMHTLVQDLPRRVALALREALGTEIRLRETRQAASNTESWRLVQRAELLVENEELVLMEEVKSALGLLDRADSLLARAESLDVRWPEPTLRRAEVATLRAKVLAPKPGSYQPAAARRAIEHAERALERDETYLPAREYRGTLRFHLAESLEEDEAEYTDALYRGAESDLRTVVELDPGNARAWWSLSQVLRRKGSFAEAKVAAHRALEADEFLDVPVGSLHVLYQAALEQEELKEAREWCATIRTMHPESMRWPACSLQLLATDAEPPNVSRAWALVDSLVERGTEADEAIYRSWGSIYAAKVLARAGRDDSARAVLTAAVPDPPPSWASYDAAHAYLLLGDEERALDMLAHRVRQSPGRAASLASDWWFRPLHGDPRLERLLQIRTEVEPSGG